MKKLISICLILSLLGCNEEAKINADIKDTTSVITPANNDQDPKPKIVDIDKWKISTKDAIKLEKYVDGCFLCDKDMNIINWNKGAYDAIQAQYPGSNIDTLKGRYKDDDDVIRYCGARGFYNGDLERCRVKKYKTLFFKVVRSGENKLEDDLYYDIVTICPPPKGCQKDVDSTKKLTPKN